MPIIIFYKNNSVGVYFIYITDRNTFKHLSVVWNEQYFVNIWGDMSGEFILS